MQRIHESSTGGTVLSDYQYLGGGALVQSDYGVTAGQPDVRNSFHANDSDDDYEGYDRFGRVGYAEWHRYGGTPATLDKFDYTYDFVP